MTRRSYTGAATPTTITAPIGSSDTTLTLAAVAGLPSSAFVITVDQGLVGEEKILVGTRSGIACSSLTRGWDGTPANAHASGATVLHTISGVDLDEANAHVNSTANVHGITGTLTDFFAGFPQPRTKYFHQMSPPLPANNCSNGSSGGTVSPTFAYAVIDSGSSAGSYGCVGGPLFDNTSNHVLFIASGVVDVTARISFSSLANSNSGLFVGIGDTGLAPSATTNGAFIFCDATGGTGGVTRGVKIVGAAATNSSTSAATTGAAVYHDYRITYPLAGGAAALYVDAVQVGTISSVPALTQPYFSVGAAGSVGGLIEILVPQASVVEI